jgi:Cys-rich protein (TIGR01571 family)
MALYKYNSSVNSDICYPPNLNSWLNAHSGYADTDLIVWNSVSAIAPHHLTMKSDVTYTKPGNPPFVTQSYQPYDLDSSQQQGAPVTGVVQTEPMLAQPASPLPGVDLDMSRHQPTHRIVRVDWSDGLCDCTNDINSAALSFLLQPLRFALTVDRAKLLGFAPALIWCGFFWLVAIVCQCYAYWGRDDISFYFQYATWVGILGAAFMGARYRIQMRTKYGIYGNDCEDCMYHLFCSCCAISQEARHVDRSVGLLV